MEANNYRKAREVLTRVHEFLSNLCRDARCDAHCSECIGASDLADDVYDVLHAPPRNCDVYDAKTAEKEFVRQTGSKSIRSKSVRWLYAAHSPSSAATLASPSAPTPGKETSKHDKIY